MYVALEFIFWCDLCWTLQHRIAIFCEQYTIVALLNFLPAFIYYQNTIISICKVRPLTKQPSFVLQMWYATSVYIVTLRDAQELIL